MGILSGIFIALTAVSVFTGDVNVVIGAGLISVATAILSLKK